MRVDLIHLLQLHIDLLELPRIHGLAHLSREENGGEDEHLLGEEQVVVAALEGLPVDSGDGMRTGG